MAIDPRNLITKLNTTCNRALQAAAGLCLSRTHFHVEIEHWLLKLVEAAGNDLGPVLRHYQIDAARVKRELDAALGKFKTGNGRAPDLSFEILDLIREAWTLASLEYGAHKIRSAHLLAAALGERMLSMRVKTSSPELGKLPEERLVKDLKELLPRVNTEENAEEAAAAATAGPSAAPSGDGQPGPTPGSKTPALDQFTHNLTANARSGKIDRILGRDAEIRQVIDILTRRRQNNPILTGEAGVGKTAVVEGLALRIVQGDVPDPLKNVELRTLDLGLLQAGAGVKGEFENRLKSVMQEVKASPVPVILFIDEAHTMIGSGGQAGQNDAANLLKPALARGELRTVAATTFDEYKKYFEGDPALKRRFQEVRVDEPDEHRAVRMLRGVVEMMEKHHGVRIVDEAVVEAVRLGIRYLPERHLPDKAVSLLDTASARVKLSQGARPPAVEDVVREIEHLGIEITAVEREQAGWADHEPRLAELKARKTEAEKKRDELQERLSRERDLVAAIRTTLAESEKPNADPKHRTELARLRAELARLQGEVPLVLPVVDAAAITQIVGGWTGIPVGKMVRNEIDTLLKLKEKLTERVVGQDHALEAISQQIRTARADLSDPRRPIGVFLLVGPSGVGKTETAMALADLLYGGDRNMVVVNMSEFKEEYKVSQLIGSPRGYEGSGEGGVLTEAVRRRPYSIVLLDEVEKAHPSVQEIFYQVFDKGMLNDSRGIEVNFKNTIILLTSNVGLQTITNACADPDTMPGAEGLAEMIRKDLLTAFKPALLGRMNVVPYYTLSDAVLRKIIEMQLKKIGSRLKENHKAGFSYDSKVVDTIASRCKEVESGARNVDHIINRTLLPAIAAEVLGRQAEGRGVSRVRVGVGEAGQFSYTIE
ncbi:MAG TPA: type VI secretion system ATPase TssH [Gemmataceae bacterium]|nr:type VI secretion system ATPase TssH [Gemmataceae bacterium]